MLPLRLPDRTRRLRHPPPPQHPQQQRPLVSASCRPRCWRPKISSARKSPSRDSRATRDCLSGQKSSLGLLLLVGRDHRHRPSSGCWCLCRLCDRGRRVGRVRVSSEGEEEEAVDRPLFSKTGEVSSEGAPSSKLPTIRVGIGTSALRRFGTAEGKRNYPRRSCVVSRRRRRKKEAGCRPSGQTDRERRRRRRRRGQQTRTTTRLQRVGGHSRHRTVQGVAVHDLGPGAAASKCGSTVAATWTEPVRNTDSLAGVRGSGALVLAAAAVVAAGGRLLTVRRTRAAADGDCERRFGATWVGRCGSRMSVGQVVGRREEGRVRAGCANCRRERRRESSSLRGLLLLREEEEEERRGGGREEG